MKIVVQYRISKWRMTETYGLKDLLWLMRHLSSPAREVLTACIIAGGHIVTLK